MYKVGDVFFKNEVYYIITEIENNTISKSMPLSRWILQNFIGSTIDALNIMQDMTRHCITI
jgi:hypothetical protein